MKVVVVPCDKDGNIDVVELRKKAEEVCDLGRLTVAIATVVVHRSTPTAQR